MFLLWLFAELYFQGEPVDFTVARSEGYLVLKGEYVSPSLRINGRRYFPERASEEAWILKVNPEEDLFIEVFDGERKTGGEKKVEEHILQYRDYPTWLYVLDDPCEDFDWLILACASRLFFSKSYNGTFRVYLPRGMAPFIYALSDEFPGFDLSRGKDLSFKVWSVLSGYHNVREMEGESAVALLKASAQSLAPCRQDLVEVDVLAGSPLLFVDLSGGGNFVFLPGKEFRIAPGKSYAIVKRYEDGYFGISTVENLHSQILKIVSFSRYRKLSIDLVGMYSESHVEFDVLNMVQLPFSAGKIKIFPLGEARVVHSKMWGIYEVIRVREGSVFASSFCGGVYSYDAFSATYFPPASGFFFVKKGGGVLWGPSSPNRFARIRLFGIKRWVVRVGEVVTFTDDSNVYYMDGSSVGFFKRGTRWKVDVKPGLYMISTARGRRVFAVLR